MNLKKIAFIVLGLVFLTGLLVCGELGVKVLRRVRQRHAAMAAYEKKEYGQAERLLLQYVQKHSDSEPEFVALANIYHEYGNTGMEAQMWLKADSLNPSNPEYRAKMLTSAVQSASYALLHGILEQKIRGNEQLTDQELYLSVISSYRSGYPMDGESTYKKNVAIDPEAFHKNDLGQMAEFIATYETLSEGERDVFLYKAFQSEDPVVRFEALYFAIRRVEQKQLDDGDTENEEETERLLKQLAEVNFFAGTPLLANYYFFKYRFDDLIVVVEPYLKSIDDINLYLLYAESCAFTGKLDELKSLEKKLKEKPDSLALLADYCEILSAYLENDNARLAGAVRKSGKLVDSPLSRFIRLRVAMANGSFTEIQNVAQEIFSYPPFHDLHNRALVLCLDYLAAQMQKPENQNAPSQMAELARVLTGYLQGNRLITDIIFFDQHKKGLEKEASLLAAQEQFPDDLILTQIAIEFLIFNDNTETALDLIEQMLENGFENRKLDLLHMLALDQLGQHDEAEELFRSLVEQSGFDLTLLAEYFQFCLDHERRGDLEAMAGKLANAANDKLKPFADFFHAAALMMGGNEEEKQEALKLLAATRNDYPEFVFYAANKLAEAGMLDEAEAKYNAIQKTYSNPSLVFVNLSELYKAEGETKKALEAAKQAYTLEKKSLLPAYRYAQLLSGEERYEEAVEVLKFPRHAVNYRADIVELWKTCMRKVIEKSMQDRKFMLAENQCRHLLIVAPDDEFGKEIMEKIREILFPKKDEGDTNADTDAAAPVTTPAA